MRKALICLVLSVFYLNVISQVDKQPLTDEQYLTWNDIDDETLSNNGQWVAYVVKPAWGDGNLYIKRLDGSKELIVPRGKDAHFVDGSTFLYCIVTPHFEASRDLKRKKTKDADLPGDTLKVVRLADLSVTAYPNIKKATRGEEWGDWLALSLDIEKDTSLTNALPRKADKDETSLVILNLQNQETDTVHYATDFDAASDATALAIAHNTSDSLELACVSVWSAGDELKEIYQSEGKTLQLGIAPMGDQIGFIADQDTTKERIRPYTIQYWSHSQACREVASSSSAIVEPGEMISEHRSVSFTEDGKAMLFGISPEPVLQDTSLLKDEIVNVEVWSYTDARLHTQQESQADEDRKRSYLALYRADKNELARLGGADLSQVTYHTKQDLPHAVGYYTEPYQALLSWEGISYKDVFVINTTTGERKLIAKKVAGWPILSPNANHIAWYNAPDTAWMSYSIATDKLSELQNSNGVPFFDELNDRPMHPSSYGAAGWTDDNMLLINDRYDIWKFDLAGNASPKRLTDGRSKKIVHRLIRLDREDPYVSEDNTLLHRFYQETKEESYGPMALKSAQSPEAFKVPKRLDRSPLRARDNNVLLYTAESYQVFPDLLVTMDGFETSKQISDANPQQSNFLWGSIELVHWTDGEGRAHEGMLAKPENFDPNRKYPMIVNFYERSADGIHRHRDMNPGRSTIVYPYYTSNDFLVFNPDIHYEIGHPGLSALEDVVSGTQHIIDMGFVDEAKIGLQGHSWGGYQIADILTRTNMFACAESGAPVVNMVSAYGGIRWGSGMSRMFQYEHTQSRLGGTLWEKPDLYLENSPIFRMDKMETPVLIMHNDEDTAVPWYQGIEYFVALRRLGKPAWLLNYNGEPHWAVKWQNRLDFNKRMSQFFHHYLKDEPMPKWMKEGVPVLEKGINQGYELIKP